MDKNTLAELAELASLDISKCDHTELLNALNSNLLYVAQIYEVDVTATAPFYGLEADS